MYTRILPLVGGVREGTSVRYTEYPTYPPLQGEEYGQAPHTISTPPEFSGHFAQEAPMDRKAIIVLATAMVAFALLSTACGAEDTSEPNTPTADAGSDVSTGDVHGGVDTTPGTDSTVDTDPAFSYDELCSECESRGLDCPPADRMLSWQQEKALSEAADDLCVEPEPSGCEQYQDVANYVWTCTNMSGVYDDYYVDDHCVLHREAVSGTRTHGRDSGPWAWEYHEPGSMSITLCDPQEEGETCWRLCTGTPK